MSKYNHLKIEKKWQKYWESKKVFVAKDFSKKPKKYVLVEFPYPSGAGLHMGHLRPYVAADVYSRYHRLKGFETIFPMGWDAFGLPAENYAIKMGVHPSITTKKNVANAKKQTQGWGLSFDWSREINTTDPDYYKWTQWLFLQFYKAGLAYEATGLINWCPKDKTGLANEEVIEGKCERCGTVVEKKELRQWYLKITDYAEKLLEGLKTLDHWPEAVKLQQENWIGKSTGAEIEFEISPTKNPFRNYLLLHGFNGSADGIFFPWLRRQLAARGYDFVCPDLPNPQNPTEEEQVNYVLKNCKFNENTILFGHSLGAVVAMKVVERLPHKIAGLVLAGGFSSPKFKDKVRPFHNTFNWNFDFVNIKSKLGFIKILADPTDYAVRIEQGKYLAKELKADFLQIAGAEPHFTALEEPAVLQSLLPKIKVFTTRPDTIFGATYLVLAPEHPMSLELSRQSENLKEIEKYIQEAKAKKEEERTAEGKEKTGVELRGVFAENPSSKEKIPVWLADYVLPNYGTGAIMAVPAHDQRDFEFAKKFNLSIKQVIEISGKSVELPVVEYGKLINSAEFNGLNSKEAIDKMGSKYGRLATKYKLRDWVFSRQRYWGEPIPIVRCEKCGIVPVPEKDLPVKLPPVKKYEPTGTGESPLASVKKWVNVKCPKCKSPAKRETNTMPQWAGSSWYWLRYVDPKNKKDFATIKKQKYWTPVDVYFGGMEHTTLHLLYSRFWNLFLKDQGLVTAQEPYTKRVPHGIILGPDGEKMSKSRGNVVNPDDIVKDFGADALRMYELFLGPHESMVAWNNQGIVGVRRFLDRVWFWANDLKNTKVKIKDSEKANRLLHKLIKKITENIVNFSFNTSVSAFMEFFNELREEKVSKEFCKTFLVLLYPFAPHLSEELNHFLGGKKSLQQQKWPEFDPALVIDQTVEIVVQINGKVKGKLTMARGAEQNTVEKEAKNIEAIKNVLASETVKRAVFVPNRLLNFVV